MAKFSIYVEVECQAGSIQKEFKWPVIPRVGETVFLAELIEGKVTAIGHFLYTPDHELMLDVALIRISDFEILRTKHGWK